MLDPYEPLRSPVAIIAASIAVVACACSGGSDESPATAVSETTVTGSDFIDREDPSPADASEPTGTEAPTEAELPPGVELPFGIDSTDGLVVPPALDVDAALAEFGRVPTAWSGPLTTEVVCDELPTEHLISMISWHFVDQRFELDSTSTCRFALANSGSVAKFQITQAEQLESPDIADGRFQNMKTPFAGVDIADRGEFHSDTIFQQLMVLDESNYWEIWGPGSEYMSDEQFLDAASLVLIRFSAAGQQS